MLLNLCPDAAQWDLTNACVRSVWFSTLPAALVFVICGFSISAHVPRPESVSKILQTVKSPFHRFLTLREAEALNQEGTTDAEEIQVPATVPLWRTVIFSFVGITQSLYWLAFASYQYIELQKEEQHWWNVVQPVLISSAWLYTAVRPVGWPPQTPPYDMFVVYLALLMEATVQIGEIWYGWILEGRLPAKWITIGFSANWLLVVLALGVTLGIPLAVPSSRVKKDDVGHSVSPEDYTNLFGWITFNWVRPLIKRGRDTTLNEGDVWELSPAIQSRPIFIKFSRLQSSSLLLRLWKANSLDLLLDFFLTFVSVLFNYAGPFFLKRILDLIDSPVQTPETRTRAYIYAFLAFICSLLKAQADVQHLWFGRRAATRIRSELMAAIYDKALKRKDFSGIIDKEKEREREREKEKERKRTQDEAEDAPLAGDKKALRARAKKRKQEEAKAEKERAATADDPKAGADVGKIVNLMAGDANRISNMVSGAYFIYGAPFEIVIAGTFLYQLLGWSAFSGFLILIAGWPLNSYIARRSIRIQKGVLAARDKRMGVLNELIGAVKFIKFFAWEGGWIDRALDARAVELQWMVKARVNSVMFYLLWTCAPILVSIISFFTFVWQGKELTVSIAFTAIALFGMIRAPLNVIPAWIVQILQTGVALKRIAIYLEEDEVTPQVSSLKSDNSSPADSDSKKGFGIVNATFKWNTIEEKGKESSNVPREVTGRRGSMNIAGHSAYGTNPSQDISTGYSVTSPSTSSSMSTAILSPLSDDERRSPTGSSTVDDVEVADHEFELRDINIMFPEGELTLVTGPTASGKTALLMALLGEMTMVENPSHLEPGTLLLSKNTSRVDENGNMSAVSYAAQTPWLRHQSIKENILFGYPYDEERYARVIECCALLPDLEVLEDGDQTEIGARGVSLSGGQKARVALARAVYARTRYVLLDDPLSAVDSYTARFLYDRLLRGPLLENRTVVLVTHHVDLVLPGAHYLVRMLEGRIDTQGTVEDLQAQGILNSIVHDASAEIKDEPSTSNPEHAQEPTDLHDLNMGGDVAELKKPRKLIKDEHRETGGVRWSIYKSYLKASSYWIWGFLFLMIIVNQILGITEKLWIKTWGEAYGKTVSPAIYAFRSFATPEHEIQVDGYLSSHQHANAYQVFSAVPKLMLGYSFPSAQERPFFYIGVYASIGLASALASVLSITAQYTGALRASRILFRRLLVTVVHATFRFHDTTPQGRMLNRFGKDIETIDSSLAGSLQAVNSSLASFLASILAVAVVFPAFLLPACIIGFAYRELAVGYLSTGRDLRRMESNTRSPIFSDFGELLEGIVTVRAFSAEKRFLDGLHRKIDLTTQMWYTFWMTNRWLLLNFDALGASAVLITQLMSIATLSAGAGLAGLCITSAMAFTTSVYWACRFWTALELDLNSVERIVEYLDLPQEPPAVIESSRPPAYWPSSATQDLVSVENLVVKYAPELPAVLQDVSFSLKAGERVGLLGRTGSGKSTLAMSILRFVDPAAGRILIDGIDISTIGVQDLRSRITFIPQDATLFSGTLRDNLDPFNEHTDSECLDVLHRVHMISQSPRTSTPSSSRGPSRTASSHNLAIDDTSSLGSRTPTEVDSKVTITLDTQVSPGGTNFSQGQRQLISMARALLRRSPVIVLDEATSSIDFATDAKIQTTIREEFTGSLLLTVAHRLRTVIDYDRLMVLDKGKIVEFDTPWNLICKEDGIFRTMCLKSGNFNELETAARPKVESS